MITRLLVANRGEVAIRVARTASDLGIEVVMVHSDDDAASLHVTAGNSAVGLGKVGVPAYLDGDAIIAAALSNKCDAIHPGYGFLSESADFAQKCLAVGIVFVGPRPETLALFGDKAQARALASAADIPVLQGTAAGASKDEIRAFMRDAGADGVMLKAVAGGGGRGMRPVFDLGELDAAYERCQSEAASAFGSGVLYAEALFPVARHVEVQIVGDGTGACSHLWDRECSLQRQRQKLVEVAPAFGLSATLRTELLEAAVKLGAAASYRGLGTIEFLVDARPGAEDRYVFIEANPRLQVEHTVTEEVLRLDLVAIQLAIAGGATLDELGLSQDKIPEPRGCAIQVRINLEKMAPDGSPRPSGGTLSVYSPPTGPGVRVDGFGYAGYKTSPRYDALLAKLISWHPSRDLEPAVARARRALSEFEIAGFSTNVPFLRALLATGVLTSTDLHTRFIEQNMPGVLAHLPRDTQSEPHLATA